MKKPWRRGTDVTMARMAGWTSLFSGYRHSVTEQRIERWVAQFQRRDRDLAARVLDAVDFIAHEQAMSAFRSTLHSIEGWHRDARHRRGRWRFVPFSASTGESGDSMLHHFRVASGLNGRQYNELFIHKSALLDQRLGPKDTVVFVDDFAGTGKQACETWESSARELVPDNPRAFLVLIAVGITARKKIEDETGLTVVSQIELGETDNIFSPKCKHFTPVEKETVLKYCELANRRYPKGFGDCGFVIVLSHTCPNDSIPILYAHHAKWQGLFRRHD